MYAVSTAALVCILALASSLAVVVQATPAVACTGTMVATATTCKEQAPVWNMDEADLAAWLFSYNDDVLLDCSNLKVGQTVSIFLL